MSTIVTRQGKGTPLLFSEVDSNFINLNNDKTENANAAITGGSINGASIGGTTASTGRFTTLTATTALISETTLQVNGNTTLDGDLLVKGGDITTNQTTFNLLNSTATTLNIGGAATTINIGANTGTLTFNNAGVVHSSTSYLKLPVGTSSQRPGSPAEGMVRYNSEISSFEGYASGAWSSLGGVKSVDGLTYILAESSAGASNDELEFYAATGSLTTSKVGGWNQTRLLVNTALSMSGTASIGTLNLTNALGISYGGTGATTAAQGLTNLLPTGEQSGYVLTTSGRGSYFWAAAGGGGGNVGTKIDTTRTIYTATSGQTVFTGTGTYVPGAGQLRVYINGIRQYSTAYTETSSTSFTLSTGVTAGAIVLAEVDGFVSYPIAAADVSNSPAGSIAATTVQAALNELDSEKAPIASPAFTGTVSGITATMVGLGNVTNESKATMFTNPTFTGTVSGVTATHVGLGNVTNESKATMFTNPTFTGTVSGVTATMVGLGNVTNESKATMFTNPVFTGTLQFNSGYGSSATAYGCRAWVNFNGTGTIAIRGSRNVTSLSDGGTGNYTINFTTAMPDTIYCAVASGQQASGRAILSVHPTTFNTGSLQVQASDQTAPYDTATVCIAIFR